MHKLARFSSNPGKLNFEGLVHLLRYIRGNKTLGLKYYADIKYAHLSDMFRQDSIKNDNQLMAFYDYSWKDCTYTGRSKGSYIIFYRGGPIDHGTHIPGPVSQSSAERMDLAHCRMLIHELLSKDTDKVPDEAPLIILDGKSAVCMSKNGKDTNNTR